MVRTFMAPGTGFWKRPTSRTYAYNLDLGEHYYHPMTTYLVSELALDVNVNVQKKEIRNIYFHPPPSARSSNLGKNISFQLQICIIAFCFCTLWPFSPLLFFLWMRPAASPD